MNRHHRHLLSIVLLLFTVTSAIADDTAAPAPGAVAKRFVRIVNDEKGSPDVLQVAIAHYFSTDPLASASVDLISAVHIADHTYYAQLNDVFKDYDAVLYELIAPSGTRVKPGRKPEGILSGAQLAMTKGLDLSFQLEQIDYSAENLVHADLSPSELKQAMQARGETPFVLFWRLVITSMREGARSSLPHHQMTMMSDLLSASSDNAMKLMMARTLARTGQLEDMFGDDANSSIVGARNARAIEVLQQQFKAGVKRIGIFYGAAHMPDFEDRLLNELGLEYRSTTWVDAWQLQAPADDEPIEFTDGDS